MERMLIIGCGDIGRRLAALAQAAGSTVSGLVRSQEAATALRRLGITPVLGDLDQGASPIAELPTAGATVVYLAPPPGGGDIDPRVRVFCGSIEPGAEPDKVVYISTSAVYGDCGEEVVTEQTPTRPSSARGRRRLDAEQLLQAWGRHRRVPVVLLRVTGIYGPGRFPLERIQSGQPVLHPAEASLTNRIQADDLARVCLAAAQRGQDGEIFNVSDGHPTTMTAYFDAVAAAFGLPAPPRVDRAAARQQMSPLMYSYFSESRQVDNRNMLSRLGIRLLYPDLQAGLAAATRKE